MTIMDQVINLSNLCTLLFIMAFSKNTLNAILKKKKKGHTASDFHFAGTV